MKGQEEIIKEYGLILLVIAVVVILLILVFNYTASHGIANPDIPNPFAKP